MKRFFTQIAIYAGLLLAIAILFDWMISAGLRKTERNHFYTMNALMNDSINADVIMLGSSRVQFAYDPHIIDSVLDCNSFNLGVSGQPFGVSLLRWQLYNRHNNPPKLVILNSDFLELRGMVDNGYEREQYYPYMLDPLVKSYLDGYGFNWADKYIPMYRYHGEYKLIFLGLADFAGVYHDNNHNPYKGYFPSYDEYNGEALEALIKDDSIKVNVYPQVVELLDSMIEQAQKDKSRIVLVQAPYYRRLKDCLQDDKSRAIYDSLSNVYGLPFLDFTDLDICNDSSYFVDGCHLNYKGSEIFTLELANNLDSLHLLP